MQLKLESEKQIWHTEEIVVVRLLVLNNSYEAATLDRRLLVGPQPFPDGAIKGFFGVSLEPPPAEERQNSMLLNPWCFYGRQRTYEHLAAGQLTLHGYLLNRPVDSLLPKGPADPDALLIAAEPLTLTIV